MEEDRGHIQGRNQISIESLFAKVQRGERCSRISNVPLGRDEDQTVLQYKSCSSRSRGLVLKYIYVVLTTKSKQTCDVIIDASELLDWHEVLEIPEALIISLRRRVFKLQIRLAIFV